MNPKDTRLSFRVRSELKEKLESVAASEGRSVAQICDAFLQAGLISYGKEGAILGSAHRSVARSLAESSAPSFEHFECKTVFEIFW